MKGQSLVLKIAMLCLVLGTIFGTTPVFAADHREAPIVDGIPEGDITDVDLFTDPNDATRVVSVMTVNPFVFDVGQFFRILNNTQDVFRQIGTSFRGRAVRSDGTSGVDGFGGFDVTSIVVSLPKSMIRGSTSKVNVWATVSERVPDRRSQGRVYTQFERMGQ